MDARLELAARVLKAADRGVRVRLLVDDMDARAKNLGLAALHAHPHIDVRMFNPFASRDGFFAFLFEGIGSFNRINRRMPTRSMCSIRIPSATKTCLSCARP